MSYLSKLKKNIYITLAIVLSSMFLSGCSNTIKKLNNSLFNMQIEKDSSVAILGVRVNNPENVQGMGNLYIKNLLTNKEYPVSLQYDGPKVIKLKPGKYKIARWTFDACKERYPNSNICKESYFIKGESSPLSGNTFTINKGEFVYLGQAVIDSKTQTLSIVNNYSQDISKLKQEYEIFNKVNVKNISNNINIRDWKFNITGKGLFGLGFLGL